MPAAIFRSRSTIEASPLSLTCGQKYCKIWLAIALWRFGWLSPRGDSAGVLQRENRLPVRFSLSNLTSHEIWSTQISRCPSVVELLSTQYRNLTTIAHGLSEGPDWFTRKLRKNRESSQWTGRTAVSSCRRGTHNANATTTERPKTVTAPTAAQQAAQKYFLRPLQTRRLYPVRSAATCCNAPESPFPAESTASLESNPPAPS